MFQMEADQRTAAGQKEAPFMREELVQHGALERAESAAGHYGTSPCARQRPIR